MEKPIIGLMGSPRGPVSAAAVQYIQQNPGFDRFDLKFFSSSAEGRDRFERLQLGSVHAADDVDALRRVLALVNCEREGWTAANHARFREAGCNFHFIDADSYGRGRRGWGMLAQPVNQIRIENAYREGCLDWTGANCVTTEWAMALHGLYMTGVIERAHAVTDQACSGAGNRGVAQYIEEAEFCMSQELGDDLFQATLNLADIQRGSPVDCAAIGGAIFNNHSPYIGSEVPGSRRSSEELKLWREWCAIYGRDDMPPASARCRRAANTRAHGMVAHITLKERLSLERVAELLANGGEWIKVFGYGRDSVPHLNPLAVIGTPFVHIGRIMYVYEDDPACREVSFEVWFDQLLWGAAYPVIKQAEWIGDQQYLMAA